MKKQELIERLAEILDVARNEPGVSADMIHEMIQDLDADYMYSIRVIDTMTPPEYRNKQ